MTAQPRRPAPPPDDASRRRPARALELPGRFRAAVFDMDGLLVDSEVLWQRAETALLARHGDRFTDDDRRWTLGRSIPEVIVVFNERLGRPPEAAHELLAEMLGIMEAEIRAGVPARPGARELVEHLAARIPVAVASNTNRPLVELTLRESEFAPHFAIVVTGDDVARGKPDPDPYLLACDRLGVAPADAVALEDSSTGIAAAVAAGLFTIAVPQFGHVDVGAADLVVGSLEELLPG